MARGTTRTRRARPGLEPMEGRLLMDGAGIAAQVATPLIEAGTATAAQVVRDPATGIPLIDPVTGRPNLDPVTGRPFVDPVTGRPYVDPVTGMLDPSVPLPGTGGTPSPGTDTPGDDGGQPDVQQPGDDDDAPAVKRLNYNTPRGARVAVNLVGPGTLAGSRVRPDGALELVYDGTGPTTQILSHATGFAPLAFVKDADVPLASQAGSGANQVGLAGLRAFNLIDGGTINLNGGVRKLQLNNVGRNTQVFLRELPEVAAAREAANLSDAGRNQTFAQDQQGGFELVLTDGGFFPVLNAGADVDERAEPPAGIRVQVNRIAADPLPGGQIGNPQIYGYDPEGGLLLRFDAVTGAVLQAIAVPSLADTAGVGLGNAGGRAVVLVGQAETVRAFDAVDGTPVGSFTTSNLAGFDSIDGIGATDLRTVLIDASPDGPGIARAINLTASLASGVAVPTTTTFRPTREFAFLGGATGVAGFDPATVLGRGFFDPQQPNTQLLGFMNINTVGAQLRELNRGGAPGSPAAPPPGSDEALGSVDQAVARVVGVEDGRNVVSLVSRTNLARVGTTRLNHPNLLAGLSESFRPDLRGKAVFSIQGDVQAFLANDARGLVLDDLGTLYLLGIGRARDSYIAGFPINHVFLGSRSNVTLVTPAARPAGGRGGFTVIPNLQPIGPLFIP